MNPHRLSALAGPLTILFAVMILPAGAVADDPLAEVSNLTVQAHTLFQQGRYPEAEQVERRVVTFLETRAPDSPALAVGLANLGELLRRQNRLSEAEPLFKRSLAIKEKVFGPNSIQVAGALNDLAINYSMQRRYAEAEPLYRRALAIGEGAGGDKSPAVAFTLNKLADLYRAEGRSDEADATMNRLREIQQVRIPTPDAPLPADAVAALFRREVPVTRSNLQQAPAIAVARGYLFVEYMIKSIPHFVVSLGVGHFVAMAFGRSRSVTKENADAWVKGYSDELALYRQVIKQRTWQQRLNGHAAWTRGPLPVGGRFLMTAVGRGCRASGFTNRPVSITERHFYKVAFEHGWPQKFEGIVVDDTIGIGAPRNDVPDLVGSGKVVVEPNGRGHIELTFADCKVTLAPR